MHVATSVFGETNVSSQIVAAFTALTITAKNINPKDNNTTFLNSPSDPIPSMFLNLHIYQLKQTVPKT